ncbi:MULTISPECIES: DUF262 domain-containing HNH endonuclease family protein [unclassified Microcoleus]|uniref:DUF262 domain-containing HNH endonuclease family protein n=1 Tax=unclassified Microcoleus TaxID=2642155 RepID=UPI002FD2F3BE
MYTIKILKVFIEQQLYSLSKLFTERLYRIPDYQRGYAWTEKQLKDFWGDLIQLEKDKNHYLGVLTLEQVSKETITTWRDDHWIIESKSYLPYYIVDGQQRLTTAIILVQSIIESVEEETRLNYNTLDQIRKKFVCDSKDRGISRSYMFGYEKDNPSYEFLKTKIFLETSDLSETPQETIYTHNLEFAKEFFRKRLENLLLDSKENIYRKLTQNLLFNIYTISTDIDVFVAFETMNNRGKLLSYLELLKNRLIYLSTKFEVDDCDKEKLRRSINETWKSMYHYLGKNKSKPLDDDLFLSNHFTIYFEALNGLEDEEFTLEVDTINNRVYRKRTKVNYSAYLLERKFTVKSIMANKADTDTSSQNEEEKDTLSLNEVYSYVSSLRPCVELWYKIMNPGDSDFSTEEKLWLDKLIRLSRRNDFFKATPLVMVFFQKQKKPEERVKLLKAIERINFLELLSQSTYHLFYLCEISSPNMVELAVKLSKSRVTPEKIIKELEEISHKITIHKEFLPNVRLEFKSDGFYKWRGIKYFFYEYDLYLQTQSKTERQKLDWIEFNNYDYETIEHIYPQNPRKECWTLKFNSYSAQEKTRLRHSLGNLLPLSRPKNASFSNNCFIDKISKKDDSTIGYRYGSYSENEITQYQDWTAKEILERGIKLLEFMEKRWNIPLGSKGEKRDFLNLKFVEDSKS